MIVKENLLGKRDENNTDAVEVIFGVFLTVITVILILMVAVKSFWLSPYLISGSSMEKTLNSGDWVVADVISSVKKGDVVIVYNPDREYNIVKRVVGMPGETVYFDDDGVVYEMTTENGEEKYTAIEESYAYYCKPMSENKTVNSVTLTDDEVFVLGDNRRNSSDSRTYGAFKIGNVKGVVKEWAINCRKQLKWLYPYI